MVNKNVKHKKEYLSFVKTGYMDFIFILISLIMSLVSYSNGNLKSFILYLVFAILNIICCFMLSKFVLNGVNITLSKISLIKDRFKLS